MPKKAALKKLAQLTLCAFLLSSLTACTGQTKRSSTTDQSIATNKIVGGGCDGCELMFVDMPDTISWIDSSEGWLEKGQKMLVTGTVYTLDGKTTAANVVLYYWQTDNNGRYSPGTNKDKRTQRHGHIRGWVKTDENGRYAIYTIRPAPYPNDSMPAHIHLSVKEPQIDNEYYIDDFVFDDDKLLTTEKRNKLENRGGSGVLRLLSSVDIKIAEHNIILGLNIPNYPAQQKPKVRSGLEIGEDNPSFIPFHAFGPDKGTRTCPVCKYGRYHGILYFVGNHPNWSEIKIWLKYLDQESSVRKKYLKAYFVYGNENGYSKDIRQKELEKIGLELNLKNIALTFVPSLTDAESEVHLNKINPAVENTFVIYKHRTIVDKLIDLKATGENFKIISAILDKTKGNYFDLAEPNHN